MSKIKITISLAVLVVVFLVAVGIGSTNIHPGEILRVILYRSVGIGDIGGISNNNPSIVWYLRLPRVLLAFIVGAALAVSGAIMQSVLRNPLASSFTLGVSSGASLGAALFFFTGLASVFLLPISFLPVSGFAFGMLTIVLVVVMAMKMDGSLSNNTIILVGMILSLFINSITTLLMALQRQNAQQLIFWQMGSFSGQRWSVVAILAPIMLVGVLLALRYHRELDIMTFGEEQAQLIGINMRRVKWVLLIIAAAITGSAIAFVGIIGFVDLAAPHVVRRIFGSRHRLIIPLSAVFGGGFMMLCDLVARTVISPGELPVGVVSALVGAPFFAYVYFSKGGRGNANA
ncbi:MAG: iron ABC transporter permease [Firmicutes bacterium]|nr:iron ABC transporter permease [Bacillota bacterium]